ncbi:MAG: MCE family protein [Methylothermaceae bacterium]|nr:MCE family protein [Methylothermaceae bacterium]
MSRQANPATIGAFVLGALAISVLTLMIYAGGELWSERESYVVYFSESVNGLNVGAPVKMRGVQVGKVNEILIQYQPEERTLRTPVVIEVDLGRLQMGDKTGLPWQGMSSEELIKAGLRAQLKLQSLVTGQLYVDLDFHPDTPVRLVGLEKKLEEIPAIPSSQEEIESTIGELVKEVRQLPLKETFLTLNSTLTHIDAVVGQPEIQSSIKKLDSILTKLDRVSGQLGPRLARVSDRLDANLVTSQRLFQHLDTELVPFLDQSRQTLIRADQTFADLSQVVGPDALLVDHVFTTLDELRDAARQVRILGETLQTQPEILLRGKQERR